MKEDKQCRARFPRNSLFNCAIKMLPLNKFFKFFSSTCSTLFDIIYFEEQHFLFSVSFILDSSLLVLFFKHKHHRKSTGGMVYIVLDVN